MISAARISSGAPASASGKPLALPWKLVASDMGLLLSRSTLLIAATGVS